MPDPIFHARTENGRLILADREAFLSYLRGLSGQDIEICVRRRRHARSLSANNFYWAVVVKLISEFSGHTPEETHEFLKARFLVDGSGDQPRIMSTTELDVSQFSTYVERCIQLAAEYGISVPEPGMAE